MWFPERECEANPAHHGGFWGPWRSSKANKAILEEVVDSIPSVSKRKHSHCNNCTVHASKEVKKTFITYKEESKEFHHTLKNILRKVKKRIKGARFLEPTVAQ